MSKAVANPLRGEVEFVLGDETFILRPTFEALVRVEQKLGGLFSIVDRATNGQVTLDDIVTVIWSCAQAGGSPLDREAIGQLIAENGVAQATSAFRTVLTVALAGPDAAKAD